MVYRCNPYTLAASSSLALHWHTMGGNGNQYRALQLEL
jgi:hypothetical protein